MGPSRIIDSFPALSLRGAQGRALRDIRDAFADGNSMVLVRAPTGSGRSLLTRAVVGSTAAMDETSPAQATDAYYMTPQVSQLDDVIEDGLLPDLKIIRDKPNYDCTIRDEEDAPIDRVPCARKRGFNCSVRRRCPYFSDRAIASNHQIATTTLTYFIQATDSGVFRKYDVVAIDEAHGLAERVKMYATIDLKLRTVPVWDDIGVPDVATTGDPVEHASRFAETFVGICKHEKDELLTRSELMPEEAARRDRLQELIGELNWFVGDCRDPQSSTTWVVGQHDGEGSPIAIKPPDPTEYFKHTVWDHGDKLAFLSVTILNKAALCRSVGPDPSKVALMDIGHTFPVENRSPYGVTQGKVTYEHHDETLPKIARLVVRLVAKHPDGEGLIYCRSYTVQAELRRRLAEMGLDNRARDHDRNDRNAELETWRATNCPEAFLSVKIEKVLDLNGDLCR